MFLIYAVMVINFPLVGCAFLFLKFQELFYFLHYFFDDPLFMEQRVVQFTGLWIFSAVSFVVEFYFIPLWSDNKQGLFQFCCVC
jgi:hypothetical protein